MVDADATIDLQTCITACIIEHLASLADFIGDRVDVGLSAITGVDAHQQHEVGAVQDMLNGGDGGGGIEADAGFFTQ